VSGLAAAGLSAADPPSAAILLICCGLSLLDGRQVRLGSIEVRFVDPENAMLILQHLVEPRLPILGFD